MAMHHSAQLKRFFPLMLSSILGAQSAPFGNPVLQGWIGNTLLWVRDQTEPRIEVEPPFGIRKAIELPVGTINAAFQDGRCFALVQSREKDDESIWVWDPQLCPSWQFYANIPVPIKVARAYPLSDGVFLLILNEAGEWGGKIGSHAIARLNKDRTLSVISAVDLSMDEPLYRKNPKFQESDPLLKRPELSKDASVTNPQSTVLEAEGKERPILQTSQAGAAPLQKFILNYKYLKLWFNQRLAFQSFIPFEDSGGALLFHYPGYILILDGKGGVRKTIKIYRNFGEDKFRNLLDYEPVLLGAALGPDGAMVLAVREEDGVFKSHAFYPAFNGPREPPRGAAESQESAIKGIRLFPRIEWWALDTNSGDLMRMDNPPSNVPLQLVTQDGTLLFQNGFPFLVERTGQVRMMLN